ncbi:carbohydrate sulfotransferase 6-like [Halichoeres trimaculatus]|uniref:carbohydrate sulfotransferase 6-like n=1 Tax=Halichoeres trimaculatus TaxID=147232 RepID=UPI003D9DFFC7
MWHCRINLSTMVFLMVLQGVAVVLFCDWYMELSSYSSKPPDDKVQVLLLSSWRSGSSFMGQVFNHHLSVFYLMEPLWHVWKRLNKPARVLRMAMRDTLRSLFQCDLSVMEVYLPQHPNISALYRWHNSRALCSPPACSFMSQSLFIDKKQCEKRCGVQGLQRAQNACSTYSHVVLKETRILDLESLYPLFQDPNLNLRIIHLVRDPRAVFQSRENAGGLLMGDDYIVLGQKRTPADELPYRVMQEICRSHVRIIERAIMMPPHFLEGRYKLVRYEDVARNPLEEIVSLFQFVGLRMTPDLENWINYMTQGENAKRGGFGVSSRNATDIAQAWRSTLPHDKVKRVQEVCREAMSLLGYRTVNSEEEQKSLEIDFLLPRELTDYLGTG